MQGKSDFYGVFSFSAAIKCKQDSGDAAKSFSSDSVSSYNS